MFPCKLGTHGQTGLPADRRHLTYTVDYVKRGKPALSPIFGKLTARKADRNAGKERWKKRMPIPRESGLTSSRSIFTREFTELLRGGIANEQKTVCAC